MNQKQTFFDWEETFEPLENVQADIYVNGSPKIRDIQFDKIEIFRSSSDLLNATLYAKQAINSNLINGEKKIYNLKIEVRFKDTLPCPYNTIIFSDANLGAEKASYFANAVETSITAQKVKCLSEGSQIILKEWYGCCNKMDFWNGFSTSKTVEESITYKYQNNISFKIKQGSESRSMNSFWVKMDTYKFMVSIIKPKTRESEYAKYVLEYREKWGGIPDHEIRHDISTFLSFITGTKLVKFGESCFDNNYITQKEFISPTPIDTSLLYQTNFPFFNDDYRRNDTNEVIKQIPKMLRRYLALKEQYRLNEVLSTLFVRSYLNFNFINYVTYIEMFANIEVDKKPTIVSRSRFREILKRLNSTTGIPKSIKDKFQGLNMIGIGKKVQRLLVKYKIDYSRYSDVFSVRGKVVHGAKIDIHEMYIASEKAKELLTILTLKKLRYSGYIRNFINDNELIHIKDQSKMYL